MRKEIMVGMNFPGNVRAENLERELQQIVDNGFDYVEYNLSDLPLICSGKPLRPYVDYVKNIFSRFPLQYTAHIGDGLNLRSLEKTELHREVLRSSIDVAAQLNMKMLTIHYSRASVYHREEALFAEACREAADYAAEKGMCIGLENIEVEYPDKVLRMIDRVGRDNFRMTLDTGHMMLAANHFDYSFEQAVKNCAPYVIHMHVNDNNGTFEMARMNDMALYQRMTMGERIPFGKGDVHLPPFWGSIPLGWVFETLDRAGYHGIYMCEYETDLYVPFHRSIQERVRAEAEEAQTRASAQ